MLSLSRGVEADSVSFDSPKSWEASWSITPQLHVFNGDGHLALAQFRKDINATHDAHLFVHPTNERGDVQGGIWSALSNENEAPLIIDGNPTTF